MAGLTNRELIAKLMELDPHAEVVLHDDCFITDVDFSEHRDWNPDSCLYELTGRAQITLENDCRCGYGG